MILLIYHQSLIFFLGTGNEDTGQAEASILVATLESLPHFDGPDSIHMNVQSYQQWLDLHNVVSRKEVALH